MRIFLKERKALPGILAVFLLAAVMPTVLFTPPAMAGDETGTGACQAQPPSSARPYYSPEAGDSPEEAAVLDRLKRSAPEELLPESLLPEADDHPGTAGAEGAAETPESGFVAAGTGAWTAPAQAYLPSGSASVAYMTDGHVLDNSGRMHVVYTKAVTTGIGQAPDAPGFTTRSLQDHYLATFNQGAWDVPGSFTQITGLEGSETVWAGDDPNGYVHVIYTKWTWGRDATSPAGDGTAYQHEDENLWYMYVSPDGSWSTPRRLTSFAGSWELIGARFEMGTDRLYGVFVANRNNETTPSSYQAQVGFVEGYLDSWAAMTELSAWDYDEDPGELEPIMWPSLAVSSLSGEVTAAWAALTRPDPVDPDSGKIDAYGCVRSAGGAWSAPENISGAAASEMWMPMMTTYRGNEGPALVLAQQFVFAFGRRPSSPRRLLHHLADRRRLGRPPECEQCRSRAVGHAGLP